MEDEFNHKAKTTQVCGRRLAVTGLRTAKRVDSDASPGRLRASAESAIVAAQAVEELFMKRFCARRFIWMLALAMASFVPACRSPEPAPQSVNRPAPRPINSIRIGKFQCNNEVTAQAVRNVFVEVLARYADVKVVQEGEADIVIEGTITMGMAGSSSSSIGGGNAFIAGKSQGAGGEYVSGVTSLVLRDGEILASASWGQDIGKGSAMMSPESVARRSADRLLPSLLQQGMKRRID